MLVFFGLATIAPDSALVGSIGNIIRAYNTALFGYFANLYPFLLLIPIFIGYKYFKKFDLRLVEFIAGIILLFFTILCIQGAIFGEDGGGAIGAALIGELRAMIGSVGVWIFNITIFILSLVLIFEDKFTNIVKNWFIIQRKSKEEIYEQPTFSQSQKPQETSTKKTRLASKMAKEKINKAQERIKKEQGKSLFDDAQDDDSETQSESSSLKSSKFANVEHLREVAENKMLLDQLEKGKITKPDDFILPPLDFLNSAPKKRTSIDESEIDKKIYDLLDKLRKFKIDGDVVRTYSGPVVTTFEFRPAPNVKVDRISNLQNDLKMALRAETIRIQSPIPGKDVVGIEIPNKDIETIYLREIFESEIFKTASSPLTIALGKDIVGQPFVADLKKLPHLLIAGTTGSGKSVGVNALILSLLYRNSPKTLRLIMVDPKMVEFSVYEDIPHLLTPIITEPKKAITALGNVVAEMERRYRLMADSKVKNIESYNEKIAKEHGEILPYIVVVIDEFADLIMTGGKDVEFNIALLAQKARACGIHLIIATQRPSKEIVTGLIKSNMPSRISFKVRSSMDSRIILDQMGAESLLGRGDMLFTPPTGSVTIRLHAPFATEDEINTVAEYLRSQQSVVYDDKFITESEDGSENGEFGLDSSEIDPLLDEAKEIIASDGKTSISYLQRRLKIGYNRAATIIEQLEMTGFLSKPDAKGQREILR